MVFRPWKQRKSKVRWRNNLPEKLPDLRWAGLLQNDKRNVIIEKAGSGDGFEPFPDGGLGFPGAGVEDTRAGR